MAFSPSYDTSNPGAAVGNREDLADYVSTLAPEETPIVSAMPKTKISATNHEWIVDKLADVDTSGTIEGTDVSAYADEFAGRARLSNYYQKLRKGYMVSDIQELVQSVGPAKFAEAEMKAVRELKRNLEATVSSNNDKVAGDAGTASMMRGLGDWIDSAGPSDVPAAYRTPAGSIHASGSLTEPVFNGLIESIYRTSGNTQNLTLVADTALRKHITENYARTTGGTDIVYRNINQPADGRVRNTVGFYESDFGVVAVVNMNPDCAPDTTNKDTGYLLNYDYLQCGELKTLGSQMTSNEGGGERGFVDWAGTLVVKHPGALGKITVLS